MKRTIANLLTRLYPRSWRQRYGAEFESLLEIGQSGIRTLVNVAWSALCEHISPTRGHTMKQQPWTFGAVTRQPSAFLPLAMSLTALTMLLVSLALHGVVRETDEGAVAHLWQLLMAGQMPIVVFFAIRWLPRAPRQTLSVLAMQVGAGLASMAPVFFLGL